MPRETAAPADSRALTPVKRPVGRPPKPAAGAPVPDPALETIHFGEDFAKEILGALGSLMAVAGSFTTGISLEESARILGFSPAEKTLLAPSAAAVVDKYATIWMREHKDEMMLAIVLFPMMGAKLRAFTMKVSEEKRARAARKVGSGQVEKTGTSQSTPDPTAAPPASSSASETKPAVN